MSAIGDVCVAHVLDFTHRKTVGASGEGSVVSHEQEGDASVVNARVRGQETEATGETFWWDTQGNRMKALPVLASRWLKTMLSSRNNFSNKNRKSFE